MNKPVIGVVAPRVTDKEKPFGNFNRFISNYSKRIIEAGGIPLGILVSDGGFDYSSLDLFDGFLFTGGPTIESWQIGILHYALTNNKPVLGVCLGMQTMAAYAWLKGEYGDLSYDVIDDNFKPSLLAFLLPTIAILLSFSTEL